MKKEYTIRDYPSNVEIYISVRDEEGALIYDECGRVSSITCTSDEPCYRLGFSLGDDETNEEVVMTSGRELGAYLRGLTTEELESWISDEVTH